MSVFLSGHVSHSHLYGHLSFWNSIQTPLWPQNMLSIWKEATSFSWLYSMAPSLRESTWPLVWWTYQDLSSTNLQREGLLLNQAGGGQWWEQSSFHTSPAIHLQLQTCLEPSGTQSWAKGPSVTEVALCMYSWGLHSDVITGILECIPPHTSPTQVPGANSVTTPTLSPSKPCDVLVPLKWDSSNSSDNPFHPALLQTPGQMSV